MYNFVLPLILNFKFQICCIKNDILSVLGECPKMWQIKRIFKKRRRKKGKKLRKRKQKTEESFFIDIFHLHAIMAKTDKYFLILF